MNILVGYTGFVGSNIYKSGRSIDEAYNSKNIEDAYGKNPDLLIYAGMRAEKYLANNQPEKDFELVLEAEENIRKINPKQLVLISTVDVYKTPINVNEETVIETENLHPYGYNRYRLECWVRANYPDALIIRLPGLFGDNIKKNFIYDFIHRIPFMLSKNKMRELSEKCTELSRFYSLQDNGFFRLKDLNADDRLYLREQFGRLGFSALNFTDSRSVFQFYPLNRLWSDIQIALKNEIKIWNPATEPVSAAELYYHLTGEKFQNELSVQPSYYNYRTLYDKEFGGENGYICSKQHILDEIKKFVEEYQRCQSASR